MRRRRIGAGGIMLLTLLGLHLAIGVGRLPDKVWARRLSEIAAYQQVGAARFLLDSAQLDGADVLEWVQANTDENCVVLWRWPAKGALEFASALLAPRLVVDDRAVPGGDTQFAGRQIAQGTVPSGQRGLITIQGTADEGLLLVVR